MHYLEQIEATERLCEAIVLQAIKDHKYACRKKDRAKAIAIEKFFTTAWSDAISFGLSDTIREALIANRKRLTNKQKML